METNSEETRRLLARLRDGESAAFAALFDQYRDYLRRIIDMRLDQRIRQRVDPSDVLQDTQIQAARRLTDYLRREPMPLHLWLRKTAQECLIKIQKRHLTAKRRTVQREVALPERSSLQLAQQLIGGGPTPSEQANHSDLARRLRQAVSQLPQPEREVVLMLDIEGLSSREAAYVLDVDRSTVNRRHGQAIIRLQEILREGGLTESQL